MDAVAMDPVYLLIAVVVILVGLDQLVVLVGQSQAVSLPRHWLFPCTFSEDDLFKNQMILLWSRLRKVNESFGKLKVKGVNVSLFLFLTDINECLSNNGGCQQRCTNGRGYHQCGCYRGYRANRSNSRKCIGKNWFYNALENCTK